MPWVLVVDEEKRSAERVRDALRADGWEVEVVGSCEAAQACLGRSPQLVVINSELAGASELIQRTGRAAGGPGSIALLPEILLPGQEPEGADELVHRPFSEQEIRLAARRIATAGRANPKASPAAGDSTTKLTSKDLFGDLLEEVEERPAASPSGPPSASRPAEVEKPRPAAAADRVREDTDVEELLSRTLSGLETPKRTARPRTTPSPPTQPKPTVPVAEQPSPPKQSAPRPEPEKAEAPKASSLKSPSVPVEAIAATPPPQPRGKSEGAAAPSTATKRASRELDLTEIEKLAGSKPAKEAASGSAFATQKLAIPTAMLGKTPPTEFGQYTLLERIAVGGMAEVWKARMKGVEGFQKTVAIKRILPHLTDSSDFVTMFIDEAKLAAQLNHNHIIHIYDLGKIGDDYFIAMEYVEGKDLRTIMNTAREKNLPLPLGLALLIASRLASALEHAHSRKDFDGKPLGLVHRDVSPQNVLISFEGDIKLCDFGIVKAVTKASKTQLGALKGKLQYMSPEQAWGRPVDARSDIFSLGAVLFEMLTGRRLFAGDSEMSVLDAVREGRIQAPRDLDPRIPLEVNALVLKALAREPENRFQTAGQMQRELDAILSSMRPQPSTLDLARYMQRLFGEVRAESAVEAASAAAKGTAGPAAAVPGAPVRPEVPSVAPASGAEVSEVLVPTKKGNPAVLYGSLAAAAVVAIGLVFFLGRSPEPQSTSPSASEMPASSPATETAPVNVPSPESPMAPLPTQPEPTVQVRPTPTEPQVVATPVPRPTPERALPAAPTPTPAPARGEARPEPQAPAPAVVAPTPAAPPVASTPEPPPTATPQPTSPPEPVRPTPPASEPTPVAAPATAPSVREGDLVSPGPGVKQPTLVSFRKPEYPPIARRLKVEGTVVVSVLVDENGRVIDVRLDQGVSQNVGINEAAIEAARSARFEPATKQGVRVKMWYTLRIPFKL